MTISVSGARQIHSTRVSAGSKVDWGVYSSQSPRLHEAECLYLFQVDWGLSVRCGGRFAYTCGSSQLIADDAGQSISRSTAGEIEDGARAERAFFRRQPSHEGSDLLRLSEPAQRDLRKHVVDMRLRHLREQWSSYRRRRDAVYPD